MSTTATVRGLRARERRLAWMLVLPALAVVTLVAALPLAVTLAESLHQHDLRAPWQGRPFVGMANYAEALGDPRCGEALLHTAFFVTASVSLELALGLVLALALHRLQRARSLVRAAVLVPWAIPTVVAALVWRFLFMTPGGPVHSSAVRLGLVEPSFVWFVHQSAAWVPIILADVWKTTPFVALILLAGLGGIDPTLYEAARMDGAGAWRRFRHITLPLLRPALLVALVFRTLDALRVFDLVYVMTAGGPGTASEPLGLYAFNVLLHHLRFGYGAALSLLLFGVALALALLAARRLGGELARVRP